MLYTLSYHCGNVEKHSIAYDFIDLVVSLDVAKGVGCS